MQIAFFEVEPWEQEYLKDKFAGSEVKFFDHTLALENITEAAQVEILSPFIYSTLDKELLDKLPNLKCIATRSTGFDHIDIEEAKKRGITVSTVPFYGENTVAEHAFALILALSRKIIPSVERTRQGGFSPEGLMGFDLKGKTLGIVGMGHIGQHTARMANGFEMKVLAFDVHQDKKMAKQLGFSYANLEDLLKQSDIITLHAPYNEHTHHMLNAQNMTLIKKGAYLVNTARGGLVETDALMQCLQNGTLAGAGLDVLEEECYIKEEAQLLSKEFPKECNVKTLVENHMLAKMDNVILTPHNAFNSREAIMRILDTTVENIKGCMAGKPVNIVK